MERKITAMKLIKWLIIACIYESILFILVVFSISHMMSLFVALPVMCFINMAVCIAGVILFGYLCCTRRLVISRRVFF
jgi:hypothetical protein